MREGTLSETQCKAYEDVWAQSGAINGMLQYYRSMPQLAPLEKVSVAGNGPVVAATQMKIPNIRITCPTLLLWGEQDQAFVKENTDGVEKYVPDLRIKRFPDASHWLQHELPSEVNLQIEKFLRS
jgi:pimeloyl-ACP methyl ester carboxylesterase